MSRPAYVTCHVCAVPVQTNPGSAAVPLHGAPKGVPLDAAHVRMATVGGREIPVHVAKRRPACAGSLAPLPDS